jgi:hypothetical protein
VERKRIPPPVPIFFGKAAENTKEKFFVFYNKSVRFKK